MKNINDLKIKIFADGADKSGMLEMNSRSYISGLTTNPTLMKRAGITDYSTFCKDILKHINDKPISFEVFSDSFDEMERQATEISSWGDNIYVKIPITNTKKEPCYDMIRRLSSRGIKLNITAIFTLEQVKNVVNVLDPNISNYISVFAGRIADTGIDPIPIMKESVELLKVSEKFELIWASPRELLNIIQADEIGCHIITVTNDILSKLKLLSYDLDEYSLDTVKMFYRDAVEAGFTL